MRSTSECSVEHEPSSRHGHLFTRPPPAPTPSVLLTSPSLSFLLADILMARRRRKNGAFVRSGNEATCWKSPAPRREQSRAFGRSSSLMFSARTLTHSTCVEVLGRLRRPDPADPSTFRRSTVTTFELSHWREAGYCRSAVPSMRSTLVVLSAMKPAPLFPSVGKSVQHGLHHLHHALGRLSPSLYHPSNTFSVRRAAQSGLDGSTSFASEGWRREGSRDLAFLKDNVCFPGDTYLSASLLRRFVC